MSETPLKIVQDELFAPRVQEYLDIQEGLSRRFDEEDPQPFIKRLIYSNWFYLMVWGGIGAFLGWALLEPYFDDSVMNETGEPDAAAYLLFPVVAGAVGLFLGAAEGIMCRNLGRAIMTGAVGLGVGFLGGGVALIPTGMFFMMMTGIAFSLWDNPQPGQMPTGMALLVLMFGRAGAWSIVSIPAGLGQGIAQRERKVIFNGVLGAVLGGMIGGFLFDPIALIFTGDDEQAWLSRMIGLTIIGLAVGLFLGLVEGWTKSAWLHMRKGPLAGKQFILFKDTTVLGSSPKAEVYLFKDEAIEPRHAIIYNRGGRFEIEDCDTADGTYVNGVALKGKRYLQAGDQVVLGKTVLEFALKQTDA
jgi:hypothetical protein